MRRTYIVNRKKKEKSMLRNEGNVYVLDLVVKVPSGAAAPIKHSPRRLMQSIKLQTEESKRSESRSTGRRSERGIQAN